MQTITEGNARIRIFTGKISKKLPVFYNPIMKFNRDVSVLLLNALAKKGMRIALPLAGTGIRGIRFKKELKNGVIKELFLNDLNPKSVELIKKNLKLNGISSSVSHLDANEFLLHGKGFDYIDVDPFGTPNPFIDTAVKRLARDGILAVTATDTGCLCGSYPDACIRKYWAKPLRNEFMHETGLRILIRKVQLIGAQYDRAFSPIFSYSKDHYFRIFFKSEKGKRKADKILNQHGYILYCQRCMNRKTSTSKSGTCECGSSFNYAGQLWLGSIAIPQLINKMIEYTKDKTIEKFLHVIEAESRINIVGFFDIHKVCKRYKLRLKRKDQLMKQLNAAPTHFTGRGLKADITVNDLINVLR